MNKLTSTRWLTLKAERIDRSRDMGGVSDLEGGGVGFQPSGERAHGNDDTYMTP